MKPYSSKYTRLIIMLLAIGTVMLALAYTNQASASQRSADKVEIRKWSAILSAELAKDEGHLNIDTVIIAALELEHAQAYYIKTYSDVGPFSKRRSEGLLRKNKVAKLLKEASPYLEQEPIITVKILAGLVTRELGVEVSYLLSEHRAMEPLKQLWLVDEDYAGTGIERILLTGGNPLPLDNAGVILVDKGLNSLEMQGLLNEQLDIAL